MFSKILFGFIAIFSLMGMGALGFYGLSETNIVGDYHHHHMNEDNWDESWRHCYAADNEYCSDDYTEWCLEEGEIYCLVSYDEGECFEFNEECLEELDQCVQY